MNVLVIGSGGRENAILWKISKNSQVKNLFATPGNYGTSLIGENIDIPLEYPFSELILFIRQKNIDLTIVGPEAYLSEGIVDVFEEKGLKIFGPNKNASMLESSKFFAKELMREANVPIPDFNYFDDLNKAKEYIIKNNPPFVIKADGLAQGKGVSICYSRESAEMSLEDIMVKKIFGKSGEKVLIEEFLTGTEASILAFVNGNNFKTMIPAQDYKKLFDNNKGPNTGGMGSFAPSPVINNELMDIIKKKIFKPVLNKLIKRGINYKGILYAGLIITKEGPKVLEFNVRFGDPETQTILMLLETDLIEIIERTMEGYYKNMKLKWKSGASVCVVLASKG